MTSAAKRPGLNQRAVVPLAVVAGWVAAHPAAAVACTACYGQTDSPLAAGMNWGIFSLLGCILVVLGGTAGFFVLLGRRAGRAALAAEEQTPF